MVKGIVKTWISDRGYGFIENPVTNSAILVKRSNLNNTNYLEQGENVQFEIKNTQNRPIAINVVSIDN
jgi:cold shock CspA family protein